MFSMVSAMDLTLTKTKYYPGENLQLTIPDAFTTGLKIDNIGVYFGDAVHKSPIVPSIIKSGTKYYYSAILPLEVGNYSLRIENMEYRELGITKTATIEKNFTIASTNESYLSFNPGVISATSDFTIAITAYNAEQDVNVNFNEGNFEKTFTLGYENQQTVTIPLANVKSSIFTNIQINSYELPAVITVNSAYNPINADELGNNYSLDEAVFANPDSLNASVLANFDNVYDINLNNRANKVPINLTLTTSDSRIMVTPKSIINFLGNQNISIKINSARDFSGNVIVSSSHGDITLPVNVKIVEKSTQVESTVPETHEGQTCTDLGGRQCNPNNNEQCNGNNVFMTDAPSGCCLGTCEVQSSSGGWLWGILLVLILVGAGGFLYWKSKKQPGVSLVDVFKKKTETFEKRMNPKPVEPVEVRKKLGNI